MLTICTYPGCGRPHKALGLCAAHYMQQRQGRPLAPLGAPVAPGGGQRKGYVAAVLAPLAPLAARIDAYAAQLRDEGMPHADAMRRARAAYGVRT